jgi:hypothetical protein
MKNGTPTITCVISCDSSEALRQAEQVARKVVAPDHAFVDIARSGSNGVQKQTTRKYNVDDLFDGIEVARIDATSLKLVFHVRARADRYWKDVLANILRAIRESVEGSSIKSITKPS